MNESVQEQSRAKELARSKFIAAEDFYFELFDREWTVQPESYRAKSELCER